MTAEPTRDAADDDAAEEALSWDAESDATHVAGPAPARAARSAGSVEPENEGHPAGDAAGQAPDGSATVRPQLSAPLLLIYGVLAGAYLLYTVGWGTTVLRNLVVLNDAFGDFMYQFGEFLALISAPLWFVAALALTRGRKPLVTVLWLVLGLVILVPLPFLLGV